MLEFVDSDLYFVQDKNNFINPLLQVGSGSIEKVPDPDPTAQKPTDPTGSGSSSLVFVPISGHNVRVTSLQYTAYGTMNQNGKKIKINCHTKA